MGVSMGVAMVRGMNRVVMPMGSGKCVSALGRAIAHRLVSAWSFFQRWRRRIP